MKKEMFGALKDITKHTSSMRHGDIVYNALVRLEEVKQRKASTSATHDKLISKDSQKYVPANTIIERETM